jgi:hypothetical protein
MARAKRQPFQIDSTAAIAKIKCKVSNPDGFGSNPPSVMRDYWLEVDLPKPLLVGPDRCGVILAQSEGPSITLQVWDQLPDIDHPNARLITQVGPLKARRRWVPRGQAL